MKMGCVCVCVCVSVCWYVCVYLNTCECVCGYVCVRERERDVCMCVSKRECLHACVCQHMCATISDPTKHNSLREAHPSWWVKNGCHKFIELLFRSEERRV